MNNEGNLHLFLPIKEPTALEARADTEHYPRIHNEFHTQMRYLQGLHELAPILIGKYFTVKLVGVFLFALYSHT